MQLLGPYPSDTAWVAARFVNDDGSLGVSTGILPFDGTTRIEIPESSAGEAIVDAWSDERLAASLDLRTDEELRLSPVRAALGTEARLPPADWQALSSPLGAPLVERPDPDSLTVGWLPSCPNVAGGTQEVVVDIRCGSVPCGTRYEQLGCRVSIPLAACGIPDLEGTVDGLGQLSLAAADGPGCISVSPPEGASASTLCEGCQVDAYTRDKVPPPPLSIRRLTLAPPASTVGLRSNAPYPGLLKALVVRDDLAFAAVAEEACEPAEFALIRVDTNAVRELDRRSVNGCASLNMTPDAMGSGVLVAAETDGGVVLSRWDADGEEVQAVTVAAEGRVRGLSASLLVDRVAILTRDPQRRRWTVHIHQLRTLDAVVSTAPFEDARGGLAFDDSGRLVVGLDEQLGFIDVLSGALQTIPVPFLGSNVSTEFDRFRIIGPDKLAAIASGARSGIQVLDGPEVRRVGLIYTRLNVVTDVTTLPQPSGWINGMAGAFDLEGGTLDGFVVGLDLDAIRFQPREHIVGRGPVVDFGTDRGGRVWARLPIEGQIIRFDETPQ